MIRNNDVILPKKAHVAIHAFYQQNVCTREIKNVNDYTGGQNMFVKLDELGTACKLILLRKNGLAA